MKKERTRMPSPALLISVLALFVALGGVSYAATQLAKNSVGARQLRSNSVNSVKVKNRTLTAADFRPGILPVVPDPGISGYERVMAGAPASPANSHEATAYCPPGKVVIGGGAAIFLGEGEVVLHKSYPDSATSYYAQSRKVGGVFAGDINHGLNVYAICADSLPAG